MDPTIIVALINAFAIGLNAFVLYRIHTRVQAVAVNVQKVETATNSMKDALVQKTKEAGEAAGKEVGLVEGILEGKRQAAAETKPQ